MSSKESIELQLAKHEQRIFELEKVHKKIVELVLLWCRWNGKEITGNDFAVEFDKRFKKLNRKKWSNYRKWKKSEDKFILKEDLKKLKEVEKQK